MNRIAWQSVPAGERENAAVLDPAQPALRCGPESTVAITVQALDPAPAEPLRACIRCAELIVLVKRNATLEKSNPQPVLSAIVEQSPSWLFAPEAGPGKALDHPLVTHMKKRLVVADPDVACAVPGDRKKIAWRNASYSVKPIGVENRHAAERSRPKVALLVLEQGIDGVAWESACRNLAGSRLIRSPASASRRPATHRDGDRS